jgi:hypothetical protein
LSMSKKPDAFRKASVLSIPSDSDKRSLPQETTSVTKAASTTRISASADSQHDPDKLPIPKATSPLIISPSSITLYKNTAGAPNVKTGFVDTTITLSNTQGKSMSYPVSESPAGANITSTTFTPSPVWTMTASSSLIPYGTFDVTISAIAEDDSVSYVGTLQMTILPMPTFTVSTSQIYGYIPVNATDFTCGDSSPITYSSGFDAADIPTVTVENSSLFGTFSFMGFSDTGYMLRSSRELPIGESIPATLTVQNNYQSFTVPCDIQT